VYTNDFSDPSSANDFTGAGFSIVQPAGFTDPAIHSAHPYANATDIVYQLKVPIEVARGNAILRYDDIALIEEGTSNDYTDPNFFDFVIVEGSADGMMWVPLAPGYDARANPQWSQAYRNGIAPGSIDSNTPGTPSMYVTHTINLLDTFQPRDVIFVRFRLHADALAFAWGWAIDNVSIQPNAIVSNSDDVLPAAFQLGQNYPNPFNPTTTIPFTLDSPAQVTLQVFDMAGRTVHVLLERHPFDAGTHQVGFDASGLASGTYLYRRAIQPAHTAARVQVATKTLTHIK